MYTRLMLLGRFSLTTGPGATAVDTASARILALLALHGRLGRRQMASLLWPEACRDRALANLRATLWRMPNPARALVSGDCQQLGLGPEVEVDLDTLGLRRDEGSADEPSSIEIDPSRPAEIDLDRLTAPLLAGWYDDWVLEERQRIGHRQLDVLKERVRGHLRAGDPSAAVVEATWAVTIDPLDEEAHRLLLQSHVAEGNVVEAIDHLHGLDRLLDEELGLPPSRETRQIVEACLL